MNSEALVQHLAQLEAEITLKDTSLREKEVCCMASMFCHLFQRQIEKLREVLNHQQTADDDFHSTKRSQESQQLYHEQLMVRKLMLAREKYDGFMCLR